MNFSKKHDGLISQSAKFLLAGGVVFLFDYIVFLISMYFLTDNEIFSANIIGKISGFALGFILHKYWTFAGKQDHKTTRQFVFYILLFAFNLALSTGLLFLLTEMTRAPVLLCRLLTDIAVVIISFLVNRQIIFKSMAHQEGQMK